VEDPQLNLKMLDPTTRVVLWSLTEHIELARTSRGDNRNFDDAVARLVGRVKALVGDSTGIVVANASSTEGLPPRAIATAQRYEHMEHAAWGALIAGGIGSVLGHSRGPARCDDFSSCDAANRSAMRRSLTVTLSSAAFGALIGWLLPTS
jgi:hypothetical protein